MARSGILGLGSRLYPGNVQRIFNKDLTRFMQSLSRECQNRASKRKNEGVVSKETVVLRRWGSSIQKFGFINGVDNVNWPPYRDSKS